MRDENIKLIFGIKIRQLRSEKKLSLSELSKATGISVSYLNEIEKGKKYPKPDKISALADALQVSYDWLVSLQLSHRLTPLAELIKSDLLTNLPLDVFGIELGDLIDLISNTPTKVSAFISTLGEIARNYDLRVERFYFSVLRSYQEMHENYFEEIEEQVENFVSDFQLDWEKPISLKDLQDLLEESFQYSIDFKSLTQYPNLAEMRSVTIKSDNPHILINPNLSETQQKFALARELAYAYNKIQERPYTFSWIKIDSFEELLNNFNASYFAAALLIPKKQLIKDLKNIFADKKFQPESIIQLIEKYHTTPEMLFHRLTNLIPKFFKLPHLFFLRFHHQHNADRFILNKEMHLAGLYNPHGSMINEHHCRRWVSLNIIKNLENQLKESPEKDTRCEAQISQYLDSDNEYFCLSIARQNIPNQDAYNSVTIGFLLNQDFKTKVKFWNDKAVIQREVGVACERCLAEDCKERVAPAKTLKENKKIDKMQESIALLQKLYSE